MGTLLRSRLSTCQTFSASYQVKQLHEIRESRFKLVAFFFGTDERGPRSSSRGRYLNLSPCCYRSQVDLIGPSEDGEEMYKKA